jgi:hypothetical protein
MMKKLMIISVIIIILLIVGGIYFWRSQISNQEITFVNESQFYVSACSNPSNPLNLSVNESEGCYAGLAEATGNSSFCYKVQSGTLRMDCAINLNDSVLCEGIQDIVIKEFCYANMNVCDKIQEPNLKNQCFATAKNDTFYCANVREDMKNYPC